MQVQISNIEIIKKELDGDYFENSSKETLPVLSKCEDISEKNINVQSRDRKQKTQSFASVKHRNNITGRLMVPNRR